MIEKTKEIQEKALSVSDVEMEIKQQHLMNCKQWMLNWCRSSNGKSMNKHHHRRKARFVRKRQARRAA